MTPLINMFMPLVENPEDYVWFDMGEMDKTNRDPVDVQMEYIFNTPFPKIAICIENKYGYHETQIIKNHGDVVESWSIFFQKEIEVGGKIYQIDDKVETYKRYEKTDHGFSVWFGDWQAPDNLVDGLHGSIAMMLMSINSKDKAYSLNKEKKSINKKRIAKGKKPLYEWRTVTIKPPSLNSQHLGSSHASPRHHQRRGHWRSLRSGKKVWVRNASVGNAALGTVFHDYQVKNLRHGERA